MELAGRRVLVDPLLTDRLLHLRRHAPTPAPDAARADVVLVSHLHADHLHVPSLRRTPADAVVVVPRGAAPLLRRLAPRRVLEVAPGDVLEVDGVRVQVLQAAHDGRRLPASRHRAPALGFRLEADGRSVWYPGDTGPRVRLDDVAAVDLALVPIGGWGPSLGDGHLDPRQAAEAVAAVGARWAVPVHHGTFWPVGLRRLAPDVHERLFTTPGPRFLQAMAAGSSGTVALLPRHGERVVLDSAA